MYVYVYNTSPTISDHKRFGTTVQLMYTYISTSRFSFYGLDVDIKEVVKICPVACNKYTAQNNVPRFLKKHKNCA